MSDKVTLEHVEQTAKKLPLPDQLKLVAHISQRLSELPWQEPDEERQQRQYVAQVETFLAMSEQRAAETIGEVESSQEIRQIREERVSRL